MSLLQVNQVSKRFGGLTANQDVSFSVDAGTVVGLIGPNGAGKTTMFNCVAGYYVPSAGSITLDGRSIGGLPPEACARAGVGRTFQVARTFTSMTACENVMAAAMLLQHNVAKARKAAMEWLAFANLQRFADKPAASMTISEQRRLAVARALAIEPKILLMDEVMAGLNPSEVREAVDVVLKIRDRGIACLIVEHVLEGIMPIADKIVVLDRGMKIAEGTPQQVSNDPAVLTAYLGD
ncbi:ABC transporter ATP-binding protein [Rhodoferax saidenbachensis]|jgi:branched-chain amino acid transport system ATP-binding protein|uniref:Branched-chain amino acid transport system ATP-binding protein n=1 Tax=Rhodoferax saidenbachensis TaxID=1484693 RepID=A0ABU1ZPK3_9BURK|nr:ABC transporter ATP-binding protein [Rhodoferax saidenbachensis]MDR7307484.1 branched-chain amino acid transport system ATP-binding protein [Rhodoferax saidenbachensis]